MLTTAGDPPEVRAQFVRRCCTFYLCALLGVWLLSLGLMYAKAVRAHTPFAPRSLFVLNDTNRFGDFVGFDPVTERFTREAGFPSIVYPAPMVDVYILFTRTFSSPLYAYLTFLVLALIAGAVGLILALRSSRVNRWPLTAVVAASAILSYPFFFLIERANMEGFICLVSALGLTAFVRRYHKTAAVLFALAASMKMFPGILLVLLLARRRYRELFLGATAFIFFSVAGLWVLNPSVPAAIHEVRAGLDEASTASIRYVYTVVGYDHSLFSIVKQTLYAFYLPKADDLALDLRIRSLLPPYMALAFGSFPFLYWFRIRKLPLLNQTVVLIVIAATFPFVSFEYTLNHLYAAWALFLLFLARDVTAGRASITWPVAMLVLACFAFLFALPPSARYGGQCKTVALMLLLGAMLAVPMKSSLLDDENAA